MRSIADIMQMKIEREALKKETDQASKDRLVAAREGAGRSRGEVGRDHPQLAGREGEARLGAARSRRSLTKRVLELEQAQRKGDFAKAGELAYGRIPELEKKLKDGESRSRQVAWSKRR